MDTQRAILITNLERAWAGDLDLLLAQYVEACVFEDKAFGLKHHGHDGLREVFQFTFTMMPDFRVSYGQHVIGETHGATEWTYTGSFHGDFQGIQHHGTPVRVDGVSFMKLRGGLILENSDYWNLAALSQQLEGASSRS